MAVTVWMGLITARLLLSGLGADGFGAFSVLLAAAALSAIVGDSLWNSAMTRLALELGRGDRERLRGLFSTALILFAVAGVLTTLVGFALSAEIGGLLNVPASLATQVAWPFRLLVLSFAIAMLATPFKALLQAHQELPLQALVDLLDSSGRLLVAAAIAWTDGQRLPWLCALLVLHTLVISTLLAILAVRHHGEARPDLRAARWLHVRSLLGFGVWDSLATSSWRIRLQGTQLLLGAAFLPATNAAYALAVYLGMLQLNFATALYRAVQPAILTAEGRGDRVGVRRLVLVSGKYMVLGMLLLLVPAMTETATLLALWLGAGHVPAGTATFTRLTVAWVAVYYLSIGYQMAAQGTPLYRTYALWLLVVDALTFGLATIVVLGLGGAAWTAPAIILMMTLVLGAGRVVLVGGTIELGLGAWLRGGVWPVAIAAGAGLAYAAVLRGLMSPGMPRLLAVAGGNALLIGPTVWLVGVESWEREHLRRGAAEMLERVRAWRQGATPVSARG